MNNMNPVVLSGQTSVLVTFMASFLIWFMFAGLLFLWIVDGRVRKEEALHAFLAAIFAWVISEMIKSFFPTLRPFEINGGFPLTLTVPLDSSFPSSHSATAFALSTSVWLHNEKRGYFFLMLASLVGWGRITGNVHYLVDILGGGILGIISAFLVEKLHLYKMVK